MYSSYNLKKNVLASCKEIINPLVSSEDEKFLIYNGILLIHKNKWNSAIFNDTEWPRDCYTKWSESDRKTNIMWFCLYV